MTWVRVDCEIAADKAIGRIAAAAKLSLNEALGCVVRVYCRLPQHARDGNLSDVTDAQLEDWTGYRGKPGAFAAAFRRELCTEAGVVKSWEKYNGSALREQDADRARKAELRAKATRPHSDPSPDERPTRRRMSGGPSGGPSAGPAGSRPDVTVTVTTTPLSGPDGPELPSARPPGPHGYAGPLFAEQEAALFAAALPHEAAALRYLLERCPFPPALVGELFAIASGQHLVRADAAPYREATIADVMRAVSEFATTGEKWSVPFFRGVVRRILSRPPEPETADARAAAAAEREKLRAAVPALVIEEPRSADELEAARVRREAAMRLFASEARKNNPPPRSARLFEAVVASPAPALDPAIS